MKKILSIFLAFSALVTFAEVQIIDGQKMECRDGLCYFIEDENEAEDSSSNASAEDPLSFLSSGETTQSPEVGHNVSLKSDEQEFIAPRIAQGFMDANEFIAFLKNEASQNIFEGKSLPVILLLVFLGGLAMNLTPCVLPMMPINLMIIGKSATRGFLYGLGIMLAYGTMGVLAAIGALAFGSIQGNPWFNAGIALLFVFLALALLDVFFIDFSKSRANVVKKSSGLFFPFFMGAVSAVLSGACVAPILIAVLLLTADLFARGYIMALALPFVLGAGMALPWPFAGAGMQVLPKPGAWMKRVNKIFGFLILCFAAWYGYLSYKGFVGARSEVSEKSENIINISSPKDFSLEGLKRPILVDCWATWCKNCTAMEHKTLSDNAVKKELQNFTVIRLQAEKITELKALPGFGAIKGLPAFVIFE